jgi:hypothetical protein
MTTYNASADILYTLLIDIDIDSVLDSYRTFGMTWIVDTSCLLTIPLYEARKEPK